MSLKNYVYDALGHIAALPGMFTTSPVRSFTCKNATTRSLIVSRRLFAVVQLAHFSSSI
jgi:hypothetical protein